MNSYIYVTIHVFFLFVFVDLGLVIHNLVHAVRSVSSYKKDCEVLEPHMFVLFQHNLVWFFQKFDQLAAQLGEHECLSCSS